MEHFILKANNIIWFKPNPYTDPDYPEISACNVAPRIDKGKRQRKMNSSSSYFQHNINGNWDFGRKCLWTTMSDGVKTMEPGTIDLWLHGINCAPLGSGSSWISCGSDEPYYERILNEFSTKQLFGFDSGRSWRSKQVLLLVEHCQYVCVCVVCVFIGFVSAKKS